MSETQFERVVLNFSRLALLVMGALALVAALSFGRVVLAPIALAIVVGLMFGPVADGMERRGVPSGLSAGVVVLLFVGVIAIAALFFIAPLSEWVARVPILWEKLRTQLVSLKAPLESLGAMQQQMQSLFGSNAAMTVEVKDGGPLQDMALMLPSLAADVLLFLAGLYFFLATRHQIRVMVLSLCFSRRMRWRSAHVFRDVEMKISRFLMAATSINLGVGVATAIAMWAYGMPSPILWGALAAVLNFIPYFGQAVMLAVLFVISLGTHPTLIGILLPVVTYALINLTADQIVFPHLVGRALTINPFFIFISIAFWLWIWGPMGGFIAVPSLLVLQSLILHILPVRDPSVFSRDKRPYAKPPETPAATTESAAIASP